LSLGIDDQTGNRLSIFNNDITNQVFESIPAHVNSMDIVVDNFPLPPGKYHFSLFSRINNDISDWVQNAGIFHVEAGDFYLSGKLPQDGQAHFYIGHHFEIPSE
jgi:lipopolysaccharide transport system ATP-binding protein